MLPQKNRISRTLFATLLKNGAFFHSPNLSFRVLKTRKDTASKFSFVVSKKISKSAVKRNLLRRRGYAALKNSVKTENKDTMNVGIVGAFFFKKGAEKIDCKSLSGEIVFLLKQARCI